MSELLLEESQEMVLGPSIEVTPDAPTAVEVQEIVFGESGVAKTAVEALLADSNTDATEIVAPQGSDTTYTMPSGDE